MKNIFIALSMLVLTNYACAQEEEKPSFNLEDIKKLMTQDSIIKQFNYQTGKVVIGDNLATVNIPEGWFYLAPKEARIFMEDMCNNEPNIGSLGLLMPDTPSMITGVKWVVEFNYSEEGHIKDDDAKDINYDDLFKELKKSMDETNAERVKRGYSSIDFIKWAQKPYYDDVNKKLHWAKELSFDKSPDHTLNYEIRILGRQGYLGMLIISEMTNFPEVSADVNKILTSTNFNDGNKYSDYNSSTDKLAEYGVGGLIAGGILAKTGILAKIGIFFLKFIKIIVIAVAGFGAFIWKKIKGKKETEEQNNVGSEE